MQAEDSPRSGDKSQASQVTLTQTGILNTMRIVHRRWPCLNMTLMTRSPYLLGRIFAGDISIARVKTLYAGSDIGE